MIQVNVLVCFIAEYKWQHPTEMATWSPHHAENGNMLSISVEMVSIRQPIRIHGVHY